jgi:hypothetical protein
MHTGLHVKYSLFLSAFNQTSISRQFFEKYSNIKFPENPSSGSLFHADRRMFQTKLVEKLETHILMSMTVAVYDNEENCSTAGQATDDNMAHAHSMPDT